MKSTRRSQQRIERRVRAYREIGYSPEAISRRMGAKPETVERMLRKSGINPNTEGALMDSDSKERRLEAQLTEVEDMLYNRELVQLIEAGAHHRLADEKYDGDTRKAIRELAREAYRPVHQARQEFDEGLAAGEAVRREWPSARGIEYTDEIIPSQPEVEEEG